MLLGSLEIITQFGWLLTWVIIRATGELKTLTAFGNIIILKFNPRCGKSKDLNLTRSWTIQKVGVELT